MTNVSWGSRDAQSLLFHNFYVDRSFQGYCGEIHPCTSSSWQFQPLMVTERVGTCSSWSPPPAPLSSSQSAAGSCHPPVHSPHSWLPSEDFCRWHDSVLYWNSSLSGGQGWFQWAASFIRMCHYGLWWDLWVNTGGSPCITNLTTWLCLHWRERKGQESQVSHNPAGMKTWSSSYHWLTMTSHKSSDQPLISFSSLFYLSANSTSPPS